MEIKSQISTEKLPQHVAIIMDGNGRWAQEKGMNRLQGHVEGVNAVRKTIEAAGKIGIQYLTIYTFSIENWSRPSEEIKVLMNLLVKAIQQETDNLIKNQIRLLTLGDLNRLPKKTYNALKICKEKTNQNNRLILVLAISYSSRWEITEAVRKIAYAIQNKKLNAKKINEKFFQKYLSTKFIPDPDLLIRTGGEYRISNYLLWQLAYTELYFTPVYWPEFGEEDFYKAIKDFQKRKRRFGRIDEQLRNVNAL